MPDLSAHLVPHRQWPLKQWFLSPGMRYYHRHRLAMEFAPGPRFYDHVDPSLRDLCRLLHEKGIRTTASCEGHDHDRTYFEQRWDELRREAFVIRGGGLVVRESQSGQEYRFKDSHYQLPWSSFSRFWEESTTHQQTGYIGIIIPPSENALDHRIRKDAAGLDRTSVISDRMLSVLLHGRFYHILINEPSHPARLRQWHRVTEWFRRQLT